VRDGGPAVDAGLEYAPAIVQPDIWYAYRDNASPPLGTPCQASYDGSNGTCPQLFPELFTGGVAPHGAAKYEYNPGNPNPTKLPPYYDGAVFFGEFGQDTLREVRLDSQNRVFKINTRWTCSSGPTARSTCSPTVTASSTRTPTPACISGSTSRASALRRPCSARTARTAGLR
jgi:hypothetical protein